MDWINFDEKSDEDSCEYGNELLGFIKCGVSLH
jgi:hypothetical protein